MPGTARPGVSVLAVACLLLAPLSATAQNNPGQIHIRLDRDLDFGQVIPGIAYPLSPSESGSASGNIQTQKDSEVFLRFILPPEMVGPSGSSLPLQFDDASAFQSLEGNNMESGYYFDPRISLSYTPTNPNGKVYFWLGGILEVPYSALNGDYEATIVIEVGYTGT
jgi:hypothetical protein